MYDVEAAPSGTGLRLRLVRAWPGSQSGVMAALVSIQPHEILKPKNQRERKWKTSDFAVATPRDPGVSVVTGVVQPQKRRPEYEKDGLKSPRQVKQRDRAC